MNTADKIMHYFRVTISFPDQTPHTEYGCINQDELDSWINAYHQSSLTISLNTYLANRLCRYALTSDITDNSCENIEYVEITELRTTNKWLLGENTGHVYMLEEKEGWDKGLPNLGNKLMIQVHACSNATNRIEMEAKVAKDVVKGLCILDEIRSRIKSYKASIEELKGGKENGTEVSTEYANYCINLIRARINELEAILGFQVSNSFL